MTDILIGGWTPYTNKISTEAQEVFNKTLANFAGVTYKPVAVASQIVSGTNLSFFCNAQGAYPDAESEAAIVQIYCPIDGEAHITSITRVG